MLYSDLHVAANNDCFYIECICFAIQFITPDMLRAAASSSIQFDNGVGAFAFAPQRVIMQPRPFFTRRTYTVVCTYLVFCEPGS